MKAYLNTILPRLRQFSLNLDNRANFIDHPWLRLDEPEHRVIFVFRSQGNELLISRDGDVSIHSWDYLGYMNSLLIELDGKKMLFKQAFLDESVMILQKDGIDEYVFMINENKFSARTEEMVLDRLTEKYLNPPLRSYASIASDEFEVWVSKVRTGCPKFESSTDAYLYNTFFKEGKNPFEY